MPGLASLARPILASLFVNGAYNQLSNPDGAAPIVEKWFGQLGVDLPLEPRQVVQANGLVMAVAGAGLSLGVAPRACAAVLAGALVPTTLAGHAFWEIEDPKARYMQRNAFFANVAALGGLLHVVATPRR